MIRSPEALAVHRTAVISYHSSPLEEPGVGDAGGMTIYVRELARELAARGIQTDIFTRAVTEFVRAKQIFPGVRVVPIEAGPPAQVGRQELPAYLESFVAGVRAFSLTQRIRYDLVHSHYWMSGLAGRRLARAWSVPLVHSYHTLGRVKDQFRAPGEAAEPQSRLDGEAEVIDSADVLVASTDEEWAQLSCLYGAPHDRLKTLHPGVDHALFRPGDQVAARSALGLGDEAVMLYVGRIQPLKGLELGIRAAGELADRLERRLLFLIVGGPSGAGGHQELVRLHELVGSLGLDKTIRFLGPHPHRLLPAFYQAADVHVVCSRSESFGLAALEAHACGMPVVGTAVGGLSYVVRDGVSGLLTDTRDPDVFAAGLHRVLSDPSLHASFSRSAIESAARFSWTKMAEGFFDLYNCLVRERLPEVCTC
jgi:D-inositol-3-phosphate glycosyltransferase